MWTVASESHLVLAALAVDAAVGDPDWLYRRIPHPTVLMGSLVARLDRCLNRGQSRGWQFLAGMFTVIAVVAAVTLVTVAIEEVLVRPLPFGAVIEVLLASTLIAYRSLFDHVRSVADALRQGIEPARQAVARIVGRDPQSLDRSGVARAAIESLAENFSDGVVAPLFWYVLAGLPGLAAYKAINTLDSMIGHRSDRYLYFGRAAARLDDLVNYLPARLAGLLFVAAAVFVPRARADKALAVMCRFAPRHRSPNAGWQEAAIAGALDFALAGPRQYGEMMVEDAWMGDGRTNLGVDDVRDSLHLYLVAGELTVAILVGFALFA